MTGPAEPDPYYRDVEEEFLRRRGAPLLLSPRDWSLIGEWQAAGIPLRIVLQGIANVFEAWRGRAPAGRRINSLSYCRQEVLALHTIYLGLRGAGAGRPVSGEEGGAGRALSRHLGRLHRGLRQAMAAASEAGRDLLVGALAEAAADVKRVRRDLKTGAFRLEDLEGRLRRLDDAVVDAARRSLPAATLAAAQESIGKDLAERAGQMTATALATTRHVALTRAVRYECALPRLTLFDDIG
jgi:hypothetical protein